ncbi:MAG: putative toxin-antitoxin system toxin component, PIN family [Oligoflexia bacterium]|nr:putative toxin-antitoxin system toxin component, PIN family [Oligoflexia bacterium]
MLKVCIDTNIWISGVMFSGSPSVVVDLAFNRKINVISSMIILEELKKNLINKFDFSPKKVAKLINRILQITDLYEPNGTIKIIPNNHTDNLILETAVLGCAKFLITGDKEHLLPLKSFKYTKIVDPKQFLELFLK